MEKKGEEGKRQRDNEGRTQGKTGSKKGLEKKQKEIMK